ncbi:portal protein [Paracoccus phage vB_PmaP_KLEP18-1]|nr:portal protein [Paracoccus phage vB_PmaP_KLEP18-1]
MKSFDELKHIVCRNWQAQSAYRKDMQDDFSFIAGHQWTDEERAFLEGNQRAPIVFNRVAPIIASVSGSEINNRTQVRFIPREIGDAKPNEILTAGADWFRDESNAEDEDSQAFSDMLICGIGATETFLDFEADTEGRPSMQRIPPWEFGWDCHAHRKGLSDSAVFFRVRQIPAGEAREMFPDVDIADINATWMDTVRDDPTEHINYPGDQYAHGGQTEGDPNPDVVTIVQVQYREKERFVEYIDPQTGEKAEMRRTEWDKLAKMSDVMPPHVEIRRNVWRQAMLGNVVLQESQPCAKASTFCVQTGHWDREDKRFYGLLRSMRDPQKFANKWLSQTLHILSVNAKGGVIVEQDAVDDVRAFEESWSASDAVSYVKPGRAGGVIPKPGPQMPVALMQLTEFAISSIRDVSGVNMELMGMREAQQAGVLEYQRRQAAMTTLSFYFDSLRFYRKTQGEVILYFLQKWIAPTGRLVRLVKEGLTEYVPLAVEDDTRQYDVIVDDSPQAPNEKERAWQVIQQMMPVLQTAGLSIEDWADILEYAPLPTSFAEKVRAKAEAAQQNPPQPSPVDIAQLEKLNAETADKQASAMYKQAQAAALMQGEQGDNPAEMQARIAKDMTAAELNAARAVQIAQQPQIEQSRLLMDWVKSQQPRA